MTSTPEQMEKAVGGDMSYRQHTFLTNYISQKGTTNQQQTLQRMWGNPALAAQAARVFTESGALQAAQDQLETYFAEARAILAEQDFAHKKEWQAALVLLANRKK